MKLGIMTEPFLKFVDQKTALKLIKKIGFDCADITLFEFGKSSDANHYFFDGDFIEIAKEIKKYADSINLPLVQAHTTFPVHRDDDEEYNQKTLEIQKDSLAICGVLGIKNVVIHPCNDWTPEENKVFFEKLLPTAKKNDVTICTENMWNWDKENRHAALAACASPENFLKHIELVNDSNFGACVDVGHANMFSMVDKNITPYNMVKTLGEYVKCFHIHDNDGRLDYHETLFTMSLDFPLLAKAIREIGYKGDLIIEINSNDCSSIEEVCEKCSQNLIAGRRLINLINGEK